jgi:hypothetical protein
VRESHVHEGASQRWLCRALLPLLLLALALLLVPNADARSSAAKPRKQRVAITCSATMVNRRGVTRRLARAGYHRSTASTWTRHHGKARRVICLRSARAGSARWVTRHLGRHVRTSARSIRSVHSISKLAFPAKLSGRFRIDLPKALGDTGWQMLDAPAATVSRYSGGATYATSDYDVVYEAGFGHVKESIVVQRRQGLRTWRWKLWSIGGTDPRIDGSGRIVYGGKVALEAPVVLNAAGKVIARPRWKLVHNVAQFSLNDRRLRLPYVVDPTADFPQRINPDKVAGSRITDSENVHDPAAPALGAASSCTKLPFDANGEAIFGSMIARSQTPGAAIATTTPSGGANGWAIQDGTTYPGGGRINAVEAPDDQTIYAAGDNGFAIKSVDGGCTWTRLTTGTGTKIRGIASPSPSVVWIVGDNGLVRRSIDGGATFTNANTTGDTTQLFDVDALDANTAVVGGKNKMVALTTTGGGAAWNPIGQSSMGDVQGVDIVDANTIFTVSNPGKIFKTTNAGASWSFQLNAGSNLWFVSAASSNVAWAVGDAGTILKTTDGNTWVAQASGTGQRINWVSAVDDNVAWAGGTGGVLLFTSNGGATWTPQASATGGEVDAGTARSATLAWAASDHGTVERYYPNGAAGSYGWTSQAAGGTTLSAGPWTVGARMCREPFSGGTPNVGFRARVWKVKVNGAGVLTSSAPLTPWSAASPSTGLPGGSCINATVPVTPTVRSMLPTEYFYVEYALKVYGGAKADETISLSVSDAATYIDFSAAAADSTPPPTNLRTSTAIGPNGWTNVTSPTFRADLNDPDWYHHIQYQVCADAACATVVATGTSANGQLLGSTTDSWTAASLPDGFYYLRARTVEDTGEADTSPWTAIDPSLANNRCSTINVGPCDKFGVDTAPPSAATPVNDGTAGDIAFTPIASSLSANWTAATDAGGIAKYEYCMSTTTNAAGCTGTIVQNWLSVGTALAVTRSGLGLSNGQIYYTCVRATDNAGNLGPAACSNGQTVDTAAPPATAAVRDSLGTDIAWSSNPSQLEANWDVTTDVAGGSGLARYDVCFSTSSTGADCGGAATSPWTANGTTTSVTRTGLGLVNGTTYYSCVRAVDNVGNIGATRCSNGDIVDLGPPSASWTSWTENSPNLYSPGGANADLLWYNPAAPAAGSGTAIATVTATDPGSGMQKVDFPNLGAGAAWGAGGSDGTVGAGNTWTWGYTFTGGGVIGDPALNNATAFDNANNTLGAPALNFRVEPDAAGPVVGTMTSMNGISNSNTPPFTQTYPLGSDALSGIARYVIDARFAPLVDNVCGAWDPWDDGSMLPGRSGAATNGTVVSTSWTMNDMNGDGVLDMHDSFCFETRVNVFDNVGNVTVMPAVGTRRYDMSNPKVAFTAPPDGSSQSGTFSINGTTTDLHPIDVAGEYADTGSGIQQVVLTYLLPDGPDADALPDASGTACTINTFTGTWDNLGWTCAWNTTALPDGLYTVSAQATDRSGRVSTIATRTYLLDNKPPVAAWHSWNETSPYTYAVGNVAWVNSTAPAGAYQLDARVTATDAGSGVNRVAFPALGAGWTPAATTNATFTSPVPVANAYTMSYTFPNPGALVAPGVQSASAVDGAGNAAPIGFEVRLDGNAPTGMTATVVDGRQNTNIVTVSMTPGSEPALESGLASWRLEYETAPLSNDTCGAWSGTWTLATSGVGIAPASYNHDVSALGSQCYHYHLLVTDNVGNVGTSAPGVPARRVDLVVPTVAITSPVDASSHSGTFNVTGTAFDAHTGIDHVRLSWTGPSASSGVICDPATLGGASPNWTFTCPWATGALDDGNYTITATSYDLAGNVSAPVSVTVLLDNQPPVLTWHSWNDNGSTFMHAVGNVAWVNPNAPAGAYQLDARVTATDLGSGVNRVSFPALGAGWLPAATTNATFTSPVPVADAYTMSYTFPTPSALAAPGTQLATAYDNAGNPRTTGFEVRLDGNAPTGMTATVVDGRQSSNLVTVAMTPGADGASESGLATWRLDYETAPLSNDTCGSWTSGWSTATSGVGIAPATYSHDVTASGSACYHYRLVVSDNVGNVGTSNPGVPARRVDLVPPVVAITAPANGSSQSATFNVTGTFSDAHTGIDHVRLAWTGPGATSGVICDPATIAGTSPNWTFSCPWATSALADGNYTITATATDLAGNAATPVSVTVLLDNKPPVAAWHSWNDNGSTFMHAVGNVAWVNPTAPAGAYQLDARVTATDLGSGVNRVAFPALGAGWTPAATTNATFTSPVPVANAYTMSYTFPNPGALVAPGVQSASAVDGAGNAAPIAFEVRLDGNAPTGMTATVANGRQNSPMVAVGMTPGADGATESGLASWALEYETAPLSNDACGAFSGTWSVATTGVGAAPASFNHDVTALGSQCYHYRLRATDNVGNVGTSVVSAGTRRVDLTVPTVAITTPANGSFQGGTFNVTGDAGDLHTGIDHVRLSFTGGSTGVICDPATLGGASPTWTFTCPWVTGSLTDGSYTITATSYDLAGNASAPVSVTITLDNQAPTVTFNSWNDYGSPYVHSVGSLAWINPAAPPATYALDARVTAKDLGSGVNRVSFPALGTGWTPAAASDATFTSPVPVANAYTEAYAFTVPGVVSAPGIQSATAYDNSGNSGPIPFEVRHDAAGPTGGSISSPNGYVPSTSVVVSFNTGVDAATGSGSRDWQLLRDDGTLTGGVCGGWNGYATVVSSGVGSTSTGTFTDTVVDGGCFRYRIRAFDNVSNSSDVDAAQVVKVDLTPPTGTVVLAPGTNPTWQYLASPTKLFVNTSAGHSGTFTATTNSNAASGILDASFPVLAAGFSGDGVQPGPGPTIAATYSWVAAASAPVNPGKFVRVESNSLGHVDLPFQVWADPTAPTGATVAHPSGFTTGTSVTVTYTTGTDGATGSGIQDYMLERETGTLAAGACTWSGTYTDAGTLNGPLSVTDGTLVTANCYRFRVRVTDRVGNIGYSPLSAPIMVDTTAPTSATMEFVESTGVGTALSTPVPNTIWYQPTLGTAGAKQQFSMRVRVVDPESGPGTVTFPAFAGNWVFGPTTLNVDGATRRYDRWNFAAEPGLVTATAANAAGLSIPVTGSVLIDSGVSSAPNWSVDYVHGYDISGSMNVSWVSDATDDLSGFQSMELVRRSWPYVAASSRCDNTAAPVDVSLGSPAGSSLVDSALVQPTCYRYFIKVTDRAENVATIWASTGGTTPQLFVNTWPTWDYKTIAEVDDIFPPAAFSLNLPTNPVLPAITTAGVAPGCETVPTFVGPAPSFTWTASSDAETGLKEYRTYLDGTGVVDATIAAPTTSWTAAGVLDGAHTIGVRAYDQRFNNTNADPAFPVSVRVDSASPNASLTTPAAGSWTVDTTPTLTWSASDMNCLSRVEVFVDGVSVAMASGTETSWTPPAALANGPHTWSITAYDSLGNTTSTAPVSFGIDVNPPAAFAVLTPTAGETVRGFVDVSWTASSDGESGLSAASAYEVWVDGVRKATLGSAVTSTTISGITNGAHTLYVRALDAVGNATSTASVTFTGYGAIPPPILDAPSNGTKTNAVPLLDWHWNSDGGPAPTDFDVLVDGLVVGNQTWPTTQMAIPDPGDGVHSWKIVQHDPYTGTVSSSTWQFTLDRTPPVNPGPLSRATTTISWPLPTDPAAPVATGIASQQFFIDDGVNPPTSSPMGGAATSHNYGLLADGTYTMWVRAIDGAGNSTDSPTITVVNDSVPPFAFALDAPPALPALPGITTGAPAPACEGVGTYVSATPTLTWAASGDATSGLAGYDVTIDGTVVASVGAGATSYTVVTPLTGGAHTWQVTAKDNFGLTRASTPAPMNVRIDAANPTIAYSAPSDNAFTADTTPVLSWTDGDDNCAARVEVTLDGTVAAVAAGNVASWSPATALADGAHTWSLRVFDSAGNVTSSGAPRTINVDTTGPTGVTAVFPTNAGTAPEQMMTFQWSSGTDPAGVARYDLTVDGTVVASGITATTKGTFAIYAGAHTWSIKAYDAVGNSSVFPFTFTATPVPDVTPPNTFNLLAPADGAAFVNGDTLSWEPAWDFHGIAGYRVYIDGALAATTASGVTSYTPITGAGTAICTIDYDPGTSAGCLTGPSFSNGKSTGSTTVLPAASTQWDIAAQAGWSSSGGAFGFGDASVTPITNIPAAGIDGDRVWTAAEYSASVPAGGADLRFEHRYRMQMVGNNAYDGGTVEIKVDTAGDGLANDPWQTTCVKGTKTTYGTSINCDYDIVSVDGGYNVVMGGASAAVQPIWHQGAFSGDPGGVIQTKLALSQFAGMDIQVRFRLGTDSCYTGMPTQQANMCTTNHETGWGGNVWRIDNVALAAPDLLPGPHTWYVEARDPAGNVRQSNQTWTFNLS